MFRCPEVYLMDFKGERSNNNPAPHNKGNESKIGLGDVRQILAEYCIVPLLTQKLHENTPHVKSVLIAAPRYICTQNCKYKIFDMQLLQRKRQGYAGPRHLHRSRGHPFRSNPS